MAARGMEDDELTIMVIVSLAIFGESTAEKRLKHATKSATWVLGEVGGVAVEKGLQDAKWEAAKYLAELTILSEKIVKTAIHDYESDLEEKDSGSFQEFLRIYEQELDKQRS